MRRTLGARAVGLALAFALAACGDGAVEPVPDPKVTGTWEGPYSSSTVVRLILSEAENGTVTGSGTFTVTGAGGLPVQIRSGTHVFPNLSLVLGGDTFNDFNYTATTTATTLTGVLQGSGFTGETLILVKK